MSDCDGQCAEDNPRLREEVELLTKQRDSLVALLVKLFNWSDPSYAHAVMHVENAVYNLRSDLAVALSEVEQLRRREETVQSLYESRTASLLEEETENDRLRRVLEEMTQCGCETCHAQARAALAGAPSETRLTHADVGCACGGSAPWPHGPHDERRALAEKVREACARECDRLHQMVLSGAGEYQLGQRTAQAARLVRALNIDELL